MPEEEIKSWDLPWVKEFKQKQNEERKQYENEMQQPYFEINKKPTFREWQQQKRQKQMNQGEVRQGEDYGKIKNAATQYYRRAKAGEWYKPQYVYPAAGVVAASMFNPAFTGKALEYGLKVFQPSTYVTGLFGTGAKAALTGTLADAGLNSYIGAEIAQRFSENPNLRNGAELGLAALPLMGSVDSKLNSARTVVNDKRTISRETHKGTIEQPLYRLRQRLREITGRDLTQNEIEDIISNSEANLYKTTYNNRVIGLQATPEDWQTLENYITRRYGLRNGFLNSEEPLVTESLATKVLNPGEEGYKLEEIIEPTTGEIKNNNFKRLWTGARGFENWYVGAADNPEKQVEKYLRTIFGGNQRKLGREIMIDNDILNKSGVMFQSSDGDLSIDSFESALKYLRLMLSQGKKYYRSPSSVGKYYAANSFGQKNRYFRQFSPEFEKMLYENKGILPDNVTIRGLKDSFENGTEFVGSDGRVLGTLIPKTNEQIVDYYKTFIDKLNKTFKQHGFEIDYPIVKDGFIHWPNLNGVFYKKGGKINVYGYNKRNIRLCI